MASKYVERIVEDECVYIDGHRFLSSVPVKDGKKYWFYVAVDRDGSCSVKSLKSEDTGRFSEWHMDLREECSLGAVET